MATFKLDNNYLKNLTKSVVYSAKETLVKDLMPNFGEFMQLNDEAFKTSYAAVADPSASIKKGINAIANSKTYQALDYGAKNVFEDLRTGKFYNKERDDRDLLKLSGMDFGDSDFEFGEIDDKDFEDDSSFTTGDKKVISSIENSNYASTVTTVNAITTAAEYTVKSSRTNTAMILQQNERLFGAIHGDMSLLNTSVKSLLDITAKSLGNVDKNLSDFFTKANKLDSERNSMLAEILKLQKENQISFKERQDALNAKKKNKVRWEDLTSDGMPDIAKYLQVISGNIKEKTSILGGFNSDSNMLATMMTSPLKFITDGLVKGLIPATVKKATEELDKTLSGVFATFMGKMENADKRNEGGVLSALYKLLGVRTSASSSIDTGNYHKGTVPFDGITRKSIVDVIPSYLRRIESALTGREETIFDYQSGKWKKASSIEAEFKNIKKSAVRNATSDINSEMSSSINKTRKAYAAIGTDKAKDFEKAMEEFYEYLYDNNGIFDPKLSMDKNNIGTDKPMLRRYYKDIRGIYKSLGYGSRMSLSKQVYNARSSENRTYRDIESAVGDARLHKHTNDSLNGSGRVDDKNIYSANKDRLLTVVDSNKMSVFDYLKSLNELNFEIALSTTNMQNIMLEGGGFGFSGKGKKYHKTELASKLGIDKDQRSKIFKSIRMTGIQPTDLQSKLSKEDAALKSAVALIEKGEVFDLRNLNEDQIEAVVEYSAAKDKFKQYNEDIVAYVESSGVFGRWLNKNIYGSGIESKSDAKKVIQKADAEDKFTYEVSADEPKEEKSGFMSKIKTLTGKFKNFAQSPVDMFAGIIQKADEAIYRVFYKDEIKDDESGEKVNGFMNLLKSKITGTFDTVKKFFTEDILPKFKKKLGISDGYGDKVKLALGSMGSGIVKKFIESNKEVYGPAYNMLDEKFNINKRIADIGKADRAGYRENSFKHYNIARAKDTKLSDLIDIADTYGYDADEYKDDAMGLRDNIARDAAKKIIKHSNNLAELTDKELLAIKNDGLASLSPKELVALAKANGITLSGNSSKELAINLYNKLLTKRIMERKNADTVASHAKGTMGSPFMGKTMLSKGELLFNNSGVSVVNGTGAYSVSQPTHILNSYDSNPLLKGMGINAGPRRTPQQDLSQENRIKNKLFNHADGTLKVDNSNAAIMASFKENAKTYSAEGIAGGVIGAIAATLLGVIGGPITGALVGSVGTIIGKSDALKDKLFGAKDKDGNRQGALVDNVVVNSIKKFAPNMLKYGMAGVIPGLLTPLGPIGGIAIGAAIGGLKASEKFNERYFGKDGKLKLDKGTENVFKKMFPNTAIGGLLGAAAGLAGIGPFGLAGTLVVGAGLGMMTATDDFKNGILGEKINGIRRGGLLGTLENAFEPIKTLGASVRDRVLNFMDEAIINPLKKIAKPTIHLLPRIAGAIPRMINRVFENSVGRPLTKIVAGFGVKWAKRLFSNKLTRGVGRAALSIAKKPGQIIGDIGDTMSLRQINKGWGVTSTMTAAERLQFRDDMSKHQILKRVAGFKGNNRNKFNLKADEFLSSERNKGHLKAKDAEQMANMIYATQDNARKLDSQKQKSAKRIHMLTNFRSNNGVTLNLKSIKKLATLALNGDKDGIFKAIKSGAIRFEDGITLNNNDVDRLLHGRPNDGGRTLMEEIDAHTDLGRRKAAAGNFAKLNKKAKDSAVYEAQAKIGNILGMSEKEYSKLSPEDLKMFASKLNTEAVNMKAGKETKVLNDAIDIKNRDDKQADDINKIKELMESLIATKLKSDDALDGSLSNAVSGRGEDFKSTKKLNKDINTHFATKISKNKIKMGKINGEPLSKTAETNLTSDMKKALGVKSNLVLDLVAHKKLPDDSSVIESISSMKKSVVLLISDMYKDGYIITPDIILEISKHPDVVLKFMRKLFSNKLVRKYFKNITKDDIDAAYDLFISGKDEYENFIHKLKVLSISKANINGKSIKEIRSSYTGNIIHNHAFGTIGRIAKTAVGGAKLAGKIISAPVKAAKGIAKINPLGAMLGGAASAVKSVTDNKFRFVKTRISAKGAEEADTSDPTTKNIMNEVAKEKKEESIFKKIQHKAMTAMSNAFGDDDNGKKKKLKWYDLIVGGLIAAPFVKKVFKSFIKPMFENYVKPFGVDLWTKYIKPYSVKVVTAVKDTAVDLFTNKLPSLWENKIQPFMTEKLPKIIGVGLGYLTRSLPEIIKTAVKTATGMSSGITETKADREGGTVSIDTNSYADNQVTPFKDAKGNPLTGAQLKGMTEAYNEQGNKVSIKDGQLVSSPDGYVATNSGAKHFARSMGQAVITSSPGIAKSIRRLGNVAGAVPIVGGVVKRSAGVVAKTSELAAKVLPTADKAIAKTAIGKVASKGADGLIEKIWGKVEDLLNKLFSQGKFAKAAGQAAEELGEKGTDGIIKKIKDKMYKVLTEKVSKNVDKLLAKGALGLLGSALGIVMIVWDFAYGMDNADGILGVKSPTMIQRLICGICNAVIQRIPLLNMILSPGMFAQPICGIFDKDFDKKQKEAQAETDKYNQEHGTNLSASEYLSKDNITYKIAKLPGKALKATVGAAKAVGKGAVGLAKDSFMDIGKIVSCAMKGDLKGFYTALPSDKDGDNNVLQNGLQFAMGTSLKAVLSPVALVSAGIHNLVNGIKSIWAAKGDIGADISGLAKAAITGDAATFFSTQTTDAEGDNGGPMKILQHVIKGALRIPLTPIAMVTIGVRNLFNTVTGAFNSITHGSEENDKIIDKAKNGEIGIFSSEYWTQGLTTGDGIGGALGFIDNLFSRVANFPLLLIHGLGNKIKGIFTGAVDGIKNLGSNIWNGAKSIVGLGTGKGTSGKGSGSWAKQIDPSVSGMRFNKSGDSEYQTIGDSGCGPAAAVNAVRASYGRGNNLVDAAKMAINGGYKETNGGTTPGYFSNYFNKNGLGSETTSNRSAMARNILNGQPTVLMGTDARGVSSSSPYGQTPHYVTVTGTDGRGNAIVQDPESRYNNQLYDLKSLINKSSVGVSARGKSGRGTSFINRTRAGIKRLPKFGRGTEGNEAKIWLMLKNKGCSSIVAAGIMGNLKQENSTYDPSLLQNDKGPGAGICQWEAYGVDGSRWGYLKGFARDTFNAEWDDLTSQVEFMWYELQGLDYFFKVNTKFNTFEEYLKADNITDATEAFEKAFERAGIPRMETRIQYAKEIYETYSGKVLSQDILKKSSTDSTASTSTGGILTKFSDLISGAYEGSNINKSLTAFAGLTNPVYDKLFGTTSSSSSSSNTTASTSSTSKGSEIEADEARNDLVKMMEYLQKHQIKYAVGGKPTRNVEEGYSDCSGTIQYVYKNVLGIDPGTSVASQIEAGKTVDANQGFPKAENLKPGDLILYRNDQGNPAHVEMYVGDGKMLGHGGGDHGEKDGPRYNNITTNMGPRYSESRRIIEDGQKYKFENTSKLNWLNGSGGNGTKPLSSKGALTNNVGKVYAPIRKNINQNGIEFDYPLGMANKSGRGTGTDYTQLIKTVISVLATIADNTDKVNTIVNILQNKLGVSVTTSDLSNATANGNTLKSKLKNALNSSNNTLDTNSAKQIMTMMNALASE